MRALRLRDDPTWRAMFARLDATAKAERRAEAERWRRLSPDARWAEMAAAVARWRSPADAVVDLVQDDGDRP